MPPLEIIVALEIIRGILYVIILLGLIMNQSWPAFMCFVHGVEITADSFFQSLVIVRVFSKRKSK
ncbi:MAG: hypothetical protein J7L07_12270 [Candidatus Odinarchaeota archaeon]|nr:hypothetical protein [Candidatus Odinarchaeota archaeon]